MWLIQGRKPRKDGQTVRPTKKLDPKPKESNSTSAPATVAHEAKPMASTSPPTSAPQPPTANKQSQTVAKLKAAGTEKAIKLDQITEKQDGKYTLLQQTPEWP